MSAINKTPGVCGGDACIRKTRIPVWLLVEARQLGISDSDFLDNHPSLTPEDLTAAWAYYEQNKQEIDDALRRQEEAMNSEVIPNAEKGLTMSEIKKTPGVCGGDACIGDTRIPVWGLVEFRQLGAPDSELLENFPSLTADDLAAAWAYYADNKEEIDEAIRQQQEA
jgi:uncharacterized protein (DUF433 family)